MKILLVEDDVKTVAYLSKGLAENGFIVDKSIDGQDGLFKALSFFYDLVILDIRLPSLDGWSIVSKIRQKNKILPILMLTAKDAIEDRVQGFELGADDYLIKPFSFCELLARIRALLRRGQTIQQDDNIKIADLEINLREHKAWRSGQRLRLTPKEFSLLTLLAKHHGEYLSRSVITERVWDIHFDSDTNTVDVMIRRLRQKVDASFNKPLIHTLRGMGYVLEER